ncbi:O-antigen ligase family protein [Cobetia crustatorum]|uniref:O-antigen ligase family protein n=1 Tax=Cobetia crustatorum TaxID=553385 RepID=UPI000469BB22|nr:O-antigen ligase family protein [Cobetia crustatorum]
MLFYISLVLASCVFLLLFRWIAKAPERGVYTAFFASGILNTISLGPLREKVGLTEVVILMTWSAMLVNRQWISRRIPLSNYQILAMLFLVGFVLIEWISFFINNIDYYGHVTESLVETLNITYGAMMVGTVLLLVQDEFQWKRCIIGWLFGSAVVVIVGLWAMTGTAPSWTIDEFTRRISSTFKFENQMASYLIPLMVIALAWCVSRSISERLRNISLLLIAGMATVLIGTGSRTAFLLIVLVAVCMAVIYIVQFKNNTLRRGYLGVSIIACVAGLVLYVVAAMSMFDGVYQLGKTPSWQRPVVMMYQNMTEGKGLDETREEQATVVIDNADVAIFLGNGPKLYGSKFNISEIHNTYAGIFIETGVVGITFLLLFLLMPLIISTRVIVSPEMKLLFIAASMGFVLLLAYNLTMYGLRQRTIWLMAGLLLSASSVSRHWKAKFL